MSHYIREEILYWIVWLIIPLLIDIVSGIGSAIVVFLAYFEKRNKNISFYPYVSILIPFHNSEKTIEKCLLSILKQSYPLNRIQVILIDNDSVDNSGSIIYKFQETHINLKMWYIKSSIRGKALALNKGLYISEGKYIINIDSDGILEENAILNMVIKFENNENINAITGVVLINFEEIQETKNFLLRQLQKCELFEYDESFIVGRIFQGRTNTMFTMSGAFSAFRKEAIFKTQLYNSETLGEDTHMTFQIRKNFRGKIEVCEDSFFYTSPIESFNKLYIQRQRWQRGEMEVASAFIGENGEKRNVNKILKYIIFKDHTLNFPRLIWIFAMIYLVFIDYPIRLLIGINLIMYFAYVFNSLIYFLISKLYINNQKDLKKYFNYQCYIVFLLPIYRLILFFFRLAGIINSSKQRAKWNEITLSEELLLIKKAVKLKLSFYYKVKEWINNG